MIHSARMYVFIQRMNAVMPTLRTYLCPTRAATQDVERTTLCSALVNDVHIVSYIVYVQIVQILFTAGFIFNNAKVHTARSCHRIYACCLRAASRCKRYLLIYKTDHNYRLHTVY